MALRLATAVAVLTYLTLGNAASLPQCMKSSSGGFKHPGIYHDCNSLNRLQSNIALKKEPFVTALNNAVERTPGMCIGNWTMAGPFEEVGFGGADGHNLPLQSDGKTIYKLTLGWYATGNSAWLERAKKTILAWGETLHILNDQIQGGEGLSYMTAAAEILRASSNSSGWRTADTEIYNAMIDRIVEPWNITEGLTRDDFFMNQGAYGNNGAMAVAVFSENRTIYDNMIRYATAGVNPDHTIDYAIAIQISGEEEFYGQVTEMGRDQGHPMGTLRSVSYMGRTSDIQGSVDFYDYSDSRLLAGFEYWSRYNSGDDNMAWEPKVIRPGGGEVYETFNATSRGRNYATYGSEPLEAIGVAYHEYFSRGQLNEMTYYAAYMQWQGIGWDFFEFGTDESVAALGY